MWGGLRGSLSLMYSSMHPLGRSVNRVERTLLNFFVRRSVRGGVFKVLERCFAGDFGRRRGLNGAFCRGIPGFLGGVRCGAAIQRTADSTGAIGRKIF